MRQDTEKPDYCRQCGACCATLQVDFHCSELENDACRGVPEVLTVTVTVNTVRMKGTDAAQPRCIALQGTVGHAVSCAIYDNRPSPCRDFSPYAVLGIFDHACVMSRRRHGLSVD